MKTVYRLEHSHSGRGVYRTGAASIASEKMNFKEALKRHLTPNEDPGLRDFWLNLKHAYNWYFGFSSINQYKDWFFTEESRAQLHIEDIVLRVYEVPDDSYKKGRAQVVFIKAQAKLVQQMDPRV